MVTISKKKYTNIGYTFKVIIFLEKHPFLGFCHTPDIFDTYHIYQKIYNMNAFITCWKKSIKNQQAILSKFHEIIEYIEYVLFFFLINITIFKNYNTLGNIIIDKMYLKHNKRGFSNRYMTLECI